jgi:hypothetical protein
MPSRELNTPQTMMPEECIDLVTPKADKKPRARRCALPSLAAAAATSLFDLTAGTPPPVSARGIADDDNDPRGSNACHDSDRPPNIPCHLPGTREYAQSNTSHALAPVTAPVTNLSSSSRKKKSRSSRCRYSAFGSPPVENRKSPFFILKLPPRGSETLSPVVDDLAGGGNSPVTLSVSRLDSDTLSEFVPYRS